MSEIQRPDPAPAELAARAGHGSRADVIASAVGYWTPEITATAALGGTGAWLLHPAALPLAGMLLAARITAAHWRRRRDLADHLERHRRQLAEARAARQDHDTEEAAS